MELHWTALLCFSATERGGVNNAVPWQEAPAADFAVIGDPVSHSLSPMMHSAAYRHLGLDRKYVSIHVPVGEFDCAMEALSHSDYVGINVTVPFKRDAERWCKSAGKFERACGAVNTIRFSDCAGINTDGPGFMRACGEVWSRIESGRDVLMLGAGGSAQAIALAIGQAHFPIRIWNRTIARANLVAQTTPYASVVEQIDLANAALVINATSASLEGNSLGIDWSRLHHDALVFDLMYSNGPTAFLEDAVRHGARHTCDGRRLLMEQGALSFEWWLGIEAPRETMLKAIGG